MLLAGERAASLEQLARAREGEARRDGEAQLRAIERRQRARFVQHAPGRHRAVRALVHQRRTDPRVDADLLGRREAGLHRVGPRRGVERGGRRALHEHLVHEVARQRERPLAAEPLLQRERPLAQPLEQVLGVHAADRQLRHVRVRVHQAREQDVRPEVGVVPRRRRLPAARRLPRAGVDDAARRRRRGARRSSRPSPTARASRRVADGVSTRPR